MAFSEVLGGRGMDWSGSRSGEVAGSCSHRNGPEGSIICGEFLKDTRKVGRRGRRCRMLLDDLKERRGYSHLKEEALDRIMWRARFVRGFGPVVRQTTKW